MVVRDKRDIFADNIKQNIASTLNKTNITSTWNSICSRDKYFKKFANFTDKYLIITTANFSINWFEEKECFVKQFKMSRLYSVVKYENIWCYKRPWGRTLIVKSTNLCSEYICLPFNFVFVNFIYALMICTVHSLHVPTNCNILWNWNPFWPQWAIYLSCHCCQSWSPSWT